MSAWVLDMPNWPESEWAKRAIRTMVRVREYQRKWKNEKRAAEPDHGNARRRAYYQANKDRLRVIARVQQMRYKELHRDRVRELARESYRRLLAQDPERVKSNSRISKRKMLYGMSGEEVAAMTSAQHGCCSICGRIPKEGRVLVIDHDHDTGAVRALLCRQCNIMLGCAKDDPNVLRSAAYYLEAHARKTEARK